MLCRHQRGTARGCLSHLPAPQGRLALVVRGAEAPPASPRRAKTTSNLAIPKRAEPHEPHPSQLKVTRLIRRRVNGCSPVPVPLCRISSDPAATGDRQGAAGGSEAPEGFQQLGPGARPSPTAAARRRCGRAASGGGRGTDCPQKSMSVPELQRRAGSPAGLYPICLSPRGGFGGQCVPCTAPLGSSSMGAHAGWHARLASHRRVPPALPRPGQGTGAASPVAMGSKSCQEEDDALLAVGLWATSPCP